jgi:glycosyltransferase involved in cell wall biosynthesis
MRVVIATVQVPFVYGGAEVLASTLRRALSQAGHEVELVSVPFQGYPSSELMREMVAFRLLKAAESMGQKSDRMIALKFPAYLMKHHHKILWLLHQHRSAYDLWGTQFSDLSGIPNGKDIRFAIQAADHEGFTECQKLFTISKNVSARLMNYNGFESKTLYPPPENLESYYVEPSKDYFFFPSRINSIKRQSLVVESLALTHNPIKIVFCGKPDHPKSLEDLQVRVKELSLQERVKFLGHVSDEEKRRLYAQSIGVVYTPHDEDYGYVAPEALAASKPLLTTRDAGGPTEFVRPGETGWLVDSDPKEIARVMDEAWENRKKAAELGKSGRELLRQMEVQWPSVLAHLLG